MKMMSSAIQPTQPFYAAGDVNGSCAFNGIDITFFVSYLKGGPGLIYCPDCPPANFSANAIKDGEIIKKQIKSGSYLDNSVNR